MQPQSPATPPPPQVFGATQVSQFSPFVPQNPLVFPGLQLLLAVSQHPVEQVQVTVPLQPLSNVPHWPG